MRAGLRFIAILLAGGLWLAPSAALAQNTTEPATTNTPATTAIGPRELQNFSLPGTTTRPAEQPASPPTTTAPGASTDTTPAPTSVATPARSKTVRQAPRTTETATAVSPTGAQVAPEASLPTSLAPPIQPTAQPALSAAATPSPIEPAGTLAPKPQLWLLPWIGAALMLVGATIFLLWRRRPREVVAGGAEFDLFSAPELPPVPRPMPAPRAAASPPKPALPAANGIVASRLRPSLEIGVQPLRCLVEDSQVTIEFEIDLFNAGTAPARAVLAEASLFNVGANQEQELAAFFAKPVGAGSRIDAIPPLKHLTLTSQVVAPRGAIQEYEFAGRKSFVPVIAFNALYEWSGGKGQTSAAYLVGRDTGGEKLGPLRLDLGPRDVRGLGARALPTVLQT